MDYKDLNRFCMKYYNLSEEEADSIILSNAHIFIHVSLTYWFLENIIGD